ncbi:MAG: DeoR family transcriptional regulator, partial [Meiothermus sp.]
MPLASLRHQNLLQLIRQHGGMSTKELAHHLGVSEATVRRDLAALAR